MNLAGQKNLQSGLRVGQPCFRPTKTLKSFFLLKQINPEFFSLIILLLYLLGSFKINFYIFSIIGRAETSNNRRLTNRNSTVGLIKENPF